MEYTNYLTNENVRGISHLRRRDYLGDRSVPISRLNPGYSDVVRMQNLENFRIDNSPNILSGRLEYDRKFSVSAGTPYNHDEVPRTIENSRAEKRYS